MKGNKKQPCLLFGWLVVGSAVIASCTEPRKGNAHLVANRVGNWPDSSTQRITRIQTESQIIKIMADTPLEHVPGWSSDQVAQMKKAWITTAEQVVAISATTEGVRSLAEQLGVSEDESRQLVSFARARLSPAKRAEMEEKVDLHKKGLGVLPPRKQE